jgi:hypothetical protein
LVIVLIKQLKSRRSSYELKEESERESSDDEATSRRVGGRGGGGATRRAGGGGATTHISTELSNEASSSHEGREAVWRRLEFPTSYIRKGGGVVRWRLELPISWSEGGVVVRLEGEANLP